MRFGDAAVEGLVGADEPGDPHRLRVSRRALGGGRGDARSARRFVVESRRRHQVARGRLHVELPAGLGRDDANDVARADREARVLRRDVDPLPEIGEEAVSQPGRRARARSSRRSAGRAAWRSSPRVRCQPPGPYARSAGAETAVSAFTSAPARSFAVSRVWSTLQRKRDGLTREARQRARRGPAARPPVEQPAVSAWHDFRLEARAAGARARPGGGRPPSRSAST